MPTCPPPTVRPRAEVEALYHENERLAYHFAGLFGRRWPAARRLGADELLQLSQIGLWEACQRLRPDRGKLSTLAHICIRHLVVAAIHEEITARIGLSLDHVGPDGAKLGEEIAAPESLDAADILDLHEAIGTLPDREQLILRQRSRGVTLREVAGEVRVTRERVRQIEAKAVRKLRESLA
jgi:RNA polymerase sigma factor (sigma-70 family)